MQRWLYSPRVVIERSKRRMLGCNKGHDTLVAQNIYRIIWVSFVLLFFSLFFFYLTNRRSSFFFSICFIFVVVDRKNLVTIHNALTTMLCVCVYVFRFPGTLMLFLLLIYSIIYRFTCCLSVFYYRYPFISLHVQTWLYHVSKKKKKKKEEEKKKKVEDDNLFSAQETHLLK